MNKKSGLALAVESLIVTYNFKNKSTPVLNSISFFLQKGEVVTLLGQSGSGKSTCAKALLGVLPPSAKIVQGSFSLGSEPPIRLNTPNVDWTGLRGKRIAMIYQDAQLALNPVQTIRTHFQQTLSNYNLGSQDEIEEKSRQMLSLLNFENPEYILDSYPLELSGGMCQRVYIALILCLQPEIVIADEPTSALDAVSQKEVLRLLKEVQKQFNLSILLITHDIGVAYEMSDRVIVLENGVIIEEGSAEAVLLYPQKKYTQTLIQAQKLPQKQLPTERKQREVLLHIEGLNKSFERKNAELRVLEEVNLELYKNETIGVLGFSGCGKSTLAKCLTGLEDLGSGKIIYHGKDITNLRGKNRKWVCGGIQIIFQNARASLNPSRSALQLVQEPLQYLNYGTRKEQESKARYYLDQVGIEADLQSHRPPQLSTGQCQRIAIARALVVEPDILICDEAVSSLDMILQKQILELMKELQHSMGFSIIMISHDIRVIRNFCETVAVMERGRFIEVIPVGCLNQSDQIYTKKLLGSELSGERKYFEGVI